MDWSLILFIAVVIFFSYRGYRKGLLESLSRILSLLAGYICAILYSAKVAALIRTNFEIEGFGGFIIASLLLFIAAALAVTLLIKLFIKIRPSKQEQSALSAYGGAMAGAMIGVIVAIALVWTFSFARDLSTTAVAKEDKSPIEALSSRVASNAVGTALSLGSAKPEISRLSTALIESPVEITQQATRLSQSKDVSQLMNDPNIHKALDAGDASALQASPTFQQLAKNPDLLALAKSTGLLQSADETDQPVEAALANRITELWGRTQQIKNDKRVQNILNDPDFLKKIQSGNPVDLLNDSQLLELSTIILSDSKPSTENTSQNSTNEKSKATVQENPAKKSNLYTWTDDNGVIHVSDTDPES